jgi:hypothetical protein
MTYMPGKTGMVSVEDGYRILRAIFPNYPELRPCNPAPSLEPVAMSRDAAVAAELMFRGCFDRSTA